MKTLKKIFYVMVVFMATALLFKGCQKDPIALYPNEYNVYTHGKGGVGSAGGIVMVDDENSPLHGVAVEIPEGALDSMVEIKISLAPDDIENPADSTALMIKFEPSRLVFQKPVTISIPYHNISDTIGLNIFHFDADSVAYTQMPKKKIDVVNNIIVGETMHFSYYTAFDNRAKIDIEMLKIGNKIGVRLKLNNLHIIRTMRDICRNHGWCNVWRVIKNSRFYDKSVFRVRLYRQRTLWIDDHIETKNYYIWRRTHGDGADALVCIGYDHETSEIVYATQNNLSSSDHNSELAMWNSGEPLVFYFDDFQPDPNHNYFVRIKWFHSKMPVQNIFGRSTPLYEFDNKEVSMKHSEMTPFPVSQLHESNAIDISYIDGDGPQPTVTTAPVTNITQTSALGGGNVTSQGNSSVSSRGVTWISSENLFNHISHDYIKTQELSSNHIDGSNNTNNQLSTGSIILYKTSENRYGKFRVVLYGYNLVIQWVTYNANGTVHSSGNYLTIRGTFNANLDLGSEANNNNNADFQWLMHTSILRSLVPINGAQFKVLTEHENAPSLSVNDGTTSSGSGTGAFTSNITGLTANTPYFLKAYATSNAGTGFGQTVRFLTQQNLNQIPEANFSGSPTSGSAPLVVSFTDMSTNTPTSWQWNFGDGNTSSQQNPTHTYNVAGNYSVSLTVSNAHGSDNETKHGYINVSDNGNGDWPIDNDTEVVDVLNPATGKTWMDRNLGASRAATSSTDAEAYGDLYQWGRAADGHQKRTSGTTSTLSNSDTPGHGDFIIGMGSPWDWRSPQNDNLWQGVNGINNPCPAGYRLPTEAELNSERLSWSSNNAAGAFASPLKLPVAGYRNFSYGSLFNVGSYGRYWSSTVDGSLSRSLFFSSSTAYMLSGSRANGSSVRCLKD